METVLKGILNEDIGKQNTWLYLQEVYWQREIKHRSNNARIKKCSN